MSRYFVPFDLWLQTCWESPLQVVVAAAQVVQERAEMRQMRASSSLLAVVAFLVRAPTLLFGHNLAFSFWTWNSVAQNLSMCNLAKSPSCFQLHWFSAKFLPILASWFKVKSDHHLELTRHEHHHILHCKDPSCIWMAAVGVPDSWLVAQVAWDDEVETKIMTSYRDMPDMQWRCGQMPRLSIFWTKFQAEHAELEAPRIVPRDATVPGLSGLSPLELFLFSDFCGCFSRFLHHCMALEAPTIPEVKATNCKKDSNPQAFTTSFMAGSGNPTAGCSWGGCLR